MTLQTVASAASALAMALSLTACATPAAQMADGSPKPRAKQTYNPAFQNSMDALNHPAVGFAPPPFRSPLNR